VVVHVSPSLATGVAVTHDMNLSDGVSPDGKAMHHRCGPVAQHSICAALKEVGVDLTSVGQVAAGIVLIRIDWSELIGTPTDRRQCAGPRKLSEVGVTEALRDQRTGRGDVVHDQTPPHVGLVWPALRVDNCATCG
jgi:hypothetical protein